MAVDNRLATTLQRPCNCRYVLITYLQRLSAQFSSQLLDALGVIHVQSEVLSNSWIRALMSSKDVVEFSLSLRSFAFLPL